MDKLSVHHRKGTKQAKSKKKPIKVVYISNPMKVTTSASKFKALVQELTGKDSNVAETAKFSAIDGLHTVSDQEMKVTDDHDVLKVPMVDPCRESPRTSDDSSFEPFDDVFTPQMLGNFAGFLSSSLSYESQVEFLRSFGAV